MTTTTATPVPTELSIHTLSPLEDNDVDENSRDASASMSDDSTNMQGNELRGIRLSQGLCPECGQLLYETVRRGVLRKKTRFQPLTIAGLVVRGQCLLCVATAGDEALAMALASLPDTDRNSTTSQTPQVEFTSNIEGVPPPATIAHCVPTNPALYPIDVIYEGNYNRSGERHGNGELRWSNGDKYVGCFWNGVRDGEGTLFFNDGSEYVGHWENNHMQGQGTRRFKNGNVFAGTYREGKRSGHGRCYFANGDMYVGEWKGDVMSGFGRYYYNHGQSFEGCFQDGKRHGKGKHQLTDGRVDIYRYDNDVRVGDGVRWSANRKRAWRLIDGKVKGKLSLVVATQLVTLCGEDEADYHVAVATTEA